MTEHFTLAYGNIKENDDMVIYEVSRAQTNLIEPEQLDELKRTDHAFFKCQHYIVDETFVRVFYKKESGYTKLKVYKNANDDLKKKIALQMLNTVEMLGTQYTTLIHPANIYVNQEGNVKYAHRGIRSVLPPQELPLPKLLQEIKKVIIYLYTSYSFSELNKLDINQIASNNAFLKNMYSASSVTDLKEVMSHNTTEPSIATDKPVLEKTKDKKSKKPFAQIGLVLAGMIVVAAIMYLFLINPQNNRIDALSQEFNHNKQSYKEEKERLENQVKDQQRLIGAYHAVVQDESERAVSLFESIKRLDESDEAVLFEQYLNLNTVESLMKVLERDDSYAIPVIERLVMLNSDEANEEILSIESTEPRIIIEQAWLDKNFSQVIEVYETIPEDNRAKALAVLSYLEENSPEKAIPLANELGDKDLQIASYEKEIELIKKNKKLDKDDKKKKIEDINKKIKKIK